MERLYVVEWSLEGDDWQEKEFTNLQDAEVEILVQVGFGNMVRMYIKEV
jgi:hypothetical protein